LKSLLESKSIKEERVALKEDGYIEDSDNFDFGKAETHRPWKYSMSEDEYERYAYQVERGLDKLSYEQIERMIAEYDIDYVDADFLFYHPYLYALNPYRLAHLRRRVEWACSDNDIDMYESLTKERVTLSEDVGVNWVKHDKQGSVVSVNSNGDKLIYHADKGLNADVFNWSVVDKDNEPLLSTGRVYYGYQISWTSPKDTNGNRTMTTYGDAVVLKCIVDKFGFNDNDVINALPEGIRSRYRACCGHQLDDKTYERGWKNLDVVHDALKDAKSNNVIDKYMK
jgi:hypothetical protein